MKITLRQKIILSSIIVALLAGFFATFFVSQYIRELLISSEKLNLEQVTSQVVDEVEQVFNQSRNLIETLATQETIIEPLEHGIEPQDPHVLQHLELFNIGDNYSAIYLMSPDGTTIVSTDEAFVGNNYGFRDYFSRALSGQPAIDIVLGVTSGKLGYYFSHPIKDHNGEVLAVAVAKLKPETIHDSISFEGRGDDSHIMLIDEYGVIVYSDVPARVFKSIGSLDHNQLQEVVQRKRFSNIDIRPLQYDLVSTRIGGIYEPRLFDFYDHVDKENKILSIARVDDLSFFIFIEEEEHHFIDPARGVSYILGTMVLLAAIFASVIISVLISRYLRPLRSLYDSATKVSKGDYNAYIRDVKGSHEFQELAEAFNAMLDSVKESRKEIEQQVNEQTKEIVEKQQEMGDQQKAILNILEDVEDEKLKAEGAANELEKFKLAVDNASDQIVITDIDGTIVYGNPVVEEITGYTLTEALGKKAGSLWRIPMPKKYYEKMWDTIKNKKQPFVSALRNRRKDGEEYDAAISISPVLDKDNEVVYFVGIERDITQEKLIDQAKTEFVSLASHQLRTPLSTINWYAEMLLNGDAGDMKPEQANYVEEIYRGNQRMVDLVNSLLNVSRLELGTFVIEPKLKDIRKIADQAIDELEHKIGEKKLTFNKKYTKTLKKIKLDEKLTFMIFQNLLSNAIKYTPEKGKVSLVIDKTKTDIKIIVSDTGMGIPKRQQDKIFTKLFRADNVRETDTEGTGLGLYVIKSIVDATGGTIQFISKEGKGTTFNITLPLSGMKPKKGTKALS